MHRQEIFQVFTNLNHCHPRTQSLKPTSGAGSGWSRDTLISGMF